MRFATALIVAVMAFSGTSARAQVAAGGQPSFHVPGYGSTTLRSLSLRPPKGLSPSVISDSVSESMHLLADAYTCPMPVAHSDTVEEEAMPVARGGTPVPMPVAKPTCSNPLDRRR